MDQPKPMRIEPKTAGKVTVTPAKTVAEELYVRKLDHPYWELRVPDAQANSYLEGNALKMVMDDEEELRHFLAEAKLMIDQSTMPKKRSIHYQIDREKYKNLRPMDALAPSELAAFEEAARAFYDKASPDRKDAHPYESFLRIHFRLPDPDKEPDAYVVHGDDFDRQLLILWGAEKQRDTSLPLIQHDVVRLRPGEATVADKLRKKLIGWEQMQKDVLALLAKTKEPLFRFIGQNVLDDKGAVKGIKFGEAVLPINKTSPLRYLIPLEMRAFHKACQEFYNRGASATSLYERELRANFQLPDPDQMPEAFRVAGSFQNPRLVISYNGTVPREKTIWLTSSPEFNIPPSTPLTPEQQVLGIKHSGPPTLTDKLQAKTISFSKIIGTAGAIVGTPILLVLIAWLLLDKSPPRPLTDTADAGVAGNQSSMILVRFNKAIDPASIAKDPSQAFELDDANGKPVPLLAAALDDTTGKFKNREIALTTSDNFKDGAEYKITVKPGLRDRKLMKNVLKAPITYSFNYHDNTPPQLGLPSSDGEDYTHLLVPFSKKLNPPSIGISDFTLDKQQIAVKAATLDQDGTTVILTVYPALQLQSEHDLAVSGVQDTAQQPNAVAPNSTVHFTFKDTLPPKLQTVAAAGAQNQVIVAFNKPLSPASATNLASYALSGKSAGSVTVYSARLLEGNKQVQLLTAPLSSSESYQLIVMKIGDVADPPNVLSQAGKAFNFTGSENRTGPQISGVVCTGDRTTLAVAFAPASPLATNSLPGRASFHLKWLSDYGPVELTNAIEDVNNYGFMPDYPGVQSLSVVLSGPLVVGSKYELSVSNLKDIWGNVNANTGLPFEPKGIGETMAVSGCQFGQNQRTIVIELNQQFDKNRMTRECFHFDGGYSVTGATLQQPDSDYSPVVVTLDRPIESSTFSGSVIVFYPGSPQWKSVAFTGPDRVNK